MINTVLHFCQGKNDKYSLSSHRLGLNWNPDQEKLKHQASSLLLKSLSATCRNSPKQGTRENEGVLLGALSIPSKLLSQAPGLEVKVRNHKNRQSNISKTALEIREKKKT